MSSNKSHYRSEVCHVIIKLMSFILFLSIFYFHKQKWGGNANQNYHIQHVHTFLLG